MRERMTIIKFLVWLCKWDMSVRVGSAIAPAPALPARHLSCGSCEQPPPLSTSSSGRAFRHPLPCARTLPALPVGRRDSLPASPPGSEPALVTPHSVQRVLVPRLVKVLSGTGSRQVGGRRGCECVARLRTCQHGLAWQAGQGSRQVGSAAQSSRVVWPLQRLGAPSAEAHSGATPCVVCAHLAACVFSQA